VYEVQIRFRLGLPKRPPDWSYACYSRARKQEKLDQIIDLPYFGDSKDVALIQVADVAQRVSDWVNMLVDRSIDCSMMYPKTGRSQDEGMFYQSASASIRAM
jgi:hypothetical protein